MTTAAVQHSPLHDLHVQLGGKLIDFHGWMLPVQYSGILAEHQAVRKTAGLFDISHMGQVLIEGPKAFDFIQSLITNDLQRIFDKGLGVYGHLCLPTGGIIDDIFVYGLKSSARFLMIVNSSTHEKDVAWLRKNVISGATIFDLTHRGGLAIQGPKALEIIRKTIPGVAELPRFGFQQIQAGTPQDTFWGSRTGYTGEEGAEFFGPEKTIAALWKELLENGKADGILPCGLGSRDTLRLEVGYPLYGHELNEDITPLEANMEWVIKWNKGDFVGRTALETQKKKGIAKKLIGFELIDRGIPRSGYTIRTNGKEVGIVVSGTFSPNLQKGIGTAFLPIDLAKIDAQLEIALPGKAAAAKIVSLPFYKK